MRPLVGSTAAVHDIRRTRRGGQWAIPVVTHREPPAHLAQPRRRPIDQHGPAYPDWIDREVVRRLVLGIPLGPRPATWAEKVAATRNLLAQGASIKQVAQRCGVNGTDKYRLIADASIRED